jgi:N-acyl-D-aspartate/D-glutamate deacylase
MARLLGTYARDEKLFTIEEAVRKVTSGAARRLGLTDRGLLRPGMMADVVVFDPAKVKDVATYAKPKQFPEGIETVLVNGQPVLVDGFRTEARPGRPLLHPVPDSAR